ncbi:MAG: site-specific integrase [Candidatus Marinimicrobia bacterium]|nr:site-specific integrase [Candidatus Neomarinimicrobiota bacterium]
MDNEKRDIHGRIEQFERVYSNLTADKGIISNNRDFIHRFIRDCRLGKTVKNRQKKRIGPARCLKYISILKILSAWLDKPFDQVSQEEMETLIENLEASRSLAPSTKLDYKKTLMKFYKWLQGDNQHLPDLVNWFDTYDPPSEIPALRREEVEQMADASNVRDRAITMFLMDSGARAEECLNVKISDLTKIDDTYKVRIVHSKTKPRTIHLPIASRYLDTWLQERMSSQEEYLFPITYDTMRMMLHRVGKRILNKRVTPHILRHSSATYYANLLNHQQLCYRYGWTMASNMPNRYIDREGIFEEETRHVVKANDLAGLEKQNVILKEEISLVKASNEQLGQQLAEIKQKYDELFEGKGFMELLASLARKQKSMAETLQEFTGKRFDVVLP